MPNSATVNWGILSTAEIAHKVVKAMHRTPSATAAAVASRSLEKAQGWARAHDVPTAYGTYDELLADARLQAIYIPLPTSMKTEWAVKAVEKGKHVLVEKPLPGAHSMEELDRILDACQKHQVQFMDGTMWLHSHRTHKIEQLLASKQIGELRRVNAAFTFAAPDEEWLNGGNGRTDSSREPMGCFGDQGWYPISSILWVYQYQMPEKVRMDHWRLNKVGTITEASGTLWFAGGRMASFDTGALSAHRSHYEIVASKGNVRVEDLTGGQGRSGNFNAYLDEFTGSGHYFVDDASGKETRMEAQPCDHTAQMIEDFSQLVLSGKPSGDWPRRSRATHATMVALMNSIAGGGSLVTL